MGYGDDLAGSETQIQKTGAILLRTVEAFNPNRPVQGYSRERPHGGIH